jgi:hypothetical protein
MVLIATRRFCFAILVCTTLAPTSPADAPALALSEQSPGSAVALMDPVRMVHDICKLPSSQAISLDAGGGSGFGVRVYSWRLSLDLPKEKRKAFRAELLARLEALLRQAGAGGEIAKSGDGNQFEGKLHFSYTLKGAAGQHDVLGSLHVYFVPGADDRVSVVLFAQESEIDLVPRLKADPRYLDNPAGLKKMLDEWEKSPTAAEARARYERGKPRGEGKAVPQ